MYELSILILTSEFSFTTNLKVNQFTNIINLIWNK